MANSPQTRKRARQNVIRNQRNRSYRSAIRTQIKVLLKVINAGDSEAAPAAYRQVTSAIDKGASKGLMHKNTASRLKSRLNKRLQQLTAA